MLFENTNEPLAITLRPKSFEEVVGQKKIIPILQKIKNPISMILYGSPGTGKTTIAKILCSTWKIPFQNLSAISSGVKEIKEIILQTTHAGRICLFLDEIHRFSASQQDSLLDAVESGKIILIGATTENPAFRINRSLLSRTQIFKLDPLESKEFQLIYENIRSKMEIPQIEDDAISLLIINSGGDARKFIGFLELLKDLFSKIELITQKMVEEVFASQVVVYDRLGENHYDFISAFIKSIRGSDPDAALFYLAAMLDSGEDPLFIMRRLVILSSEDIGNASVNALQLAGAAFEILEKIGMPEGRIILSQVTVFLASCPKSNASYFAMESAIKFLKTYNKKINIPNHLKNAPTFLHKRERNSDGYKYPHDFPDGFVEESYFPEDISVSPPQFYFPTQFGNDKLLRERLKFLWEKTGKKKYGEKRP
jgi:putative ATPase